MTDEFIKKVQLDGKWWETTIWKNQIPQTIRKVKLDEVTQKLSHVFNEKYSKRIFENYGRIKFEEIVKRDFHFHPFLNSFIFTFDRTAFELGYFLAELFPNNCKIPRAIIKKLKSKKEFQAIFWELQIGATLKKLHGQINYEVENNAKRPDWSFLTSNGQTCFVEVKSQKLSKKSLNLAHQRIQLTSFANKIFCDIFKNDIPNIVCEASSLLETKITEHEDELEDFLHQVTTSYLKPLAIELNLESPIQNLKNEYFELHSSDGSFCIQFQEENEFSDFNRVLSITKEAILQIHSENELGLVFVQVSNPFYSKAFFEKLSRVINEDCSYKNLIGIFLYSKKKADRQVCPYQFRAHHYISGPKKSSLAKEWHHKVREYLFNSESLF